jgi:hypothetical protein
MRKYKVTVVYESGAKVTMRCKAFSIEKTPGQGITSVEWDKPRPRPLVFGVGHVVAVWSKRAWFPW